ncbi:MAG: MFS transporter [Alphaproteobacteria bacterium]
MPATESAPQAVAGARRTVLMLAACQALAMTGMTIVATTASIVGSMLAPDRALSTLPVAVQMAGMMSATIPAALLMARIGRRPGFWIGTALGAVGAVIATIAILQANFVLFCLGTFLNGMYNGVAQQYRFAASEIAGEAYRAKAISLVLAGGVVAAVFGPELAKWSSRLFDPIAFAGCYVVIVGLCLAAAILLGFIRLPKSPPVLRSRGRPLAVIVAQPTFVAAVIAAMVGYGVMSLVMTATPIAMLDCGHVFADAAFVIQWHVLGMYAPSFVTGHLIARFGESRILLTGAVLLLLCCAINLAGIGVIHFWAANLVLGVGWNFLFIGGTSLLTRTYRPEEKGKAQGLNDFLVFGTVAASAFASGALLSSVGWAMVQIAMIPFILIAAGAIVWWRRQMPAATPQIAGS